MKLHVSLEAELFDVLVELLGDQRLERSSLRVLAGARGLELGRPYMNLCQQGLIEETRDRPGFFRRLFGARGTLWVRVTDHGREVAARLADSAEVKAAPVAEEAPTLPPVMATEPPDAADSVIGREPEPTVAEVDVLQPTADTEIPAVATPNPVTATRRPPAQRRFTPLDFTETLGGAPIDQGLRVPESDRLDGLAESLGLLGFELTDAGKFLAADRWAQGLNDAQVALEIMTTALAHAARLDATGTTKLDREAVAGLVDRVTGTFGAFVGEGLLETESLTEARALMTSFLHESAGVLGYLSDPQRGMAPPAVCPDEIYHRVEVADE